MLTTQAPRGTKDVLPAESYRWQYVEAKMRQAAAEAGYREVRTPVFEHTELFLRGVGDTTDIVQKEMYTFQEWENQSAQVKSKLNFFNRAHAAFWRKYMSDRATVEPDSKLGRISIPGKLLESIGANKEVVFAGNDYKIEIWAKEKYQAATISNEEFLTIAGQLSQER